MAGKGTARATNDAPKAGLKQENEALKAVRAEKGENPYKVTHCTSRGSCGPSCAKYGNSARTSGRSEV